MVITGIIRQVYRPEPERDSDGTAKDMTMVMPEMTVMTLKANGIKMAAKGITGVKMITKGKIMSTKDVKMSTKAIIMNCLCGFFLAYEDFGRMFDNSFPACAFFFKSED